MNEKNTTRHADTCEWLLLEYDEDNANALVTIVIRNEMPPSIHPEDYPILVNLYWREAENTKNGKLPTQTMDRMHQMEKLLNNMDCEAVGFMMFSIMGNSRKEWIWYAKDEDLFLSSLNECISHSDAFPIELETAPADSWSAYRDIIDQLK